jgi:hypothetical protein
VAGLTLDTGALIGYERRDRRVLEFLRSAHIRRVPLVVPVGVLAQAWRGDQSARIAMLVRTAAVEVMTEESARLAGELCAVAGLSDVIDAAVVAGAARRRDDILTSDPRDLRAFAAALPRLGLSGPGRIIDLNDLALRP